MSVVVQLAADLKNYVDVYRGAISEDCLYPDDTVKHFTTFFNEAQAGEEFSFPRFRLSQVSQPFQVAFTHKGDAEFSGEKYTQRRGKIDMLINPDEIVGNWVGHLNSLRGQNTGAGVSGQAYDEKLLREQMPLVQYIIANAILHHNEERETDVIYKGVYVAPTPGTASPAGERVDGMEKLMTDAATASKYTPFAMGAYTPADTFEYLETFFDNIPDKYKGKPIKLFVEHQKMIDYARDKRGTFNWSQQLADLFKIDFSTIEIVPTHSMAGKNRVWATMPTNLARMVHKTNGPGENADVQVQDRNVKFMTDYHESFGVRDWDFFWSNDQV